MLHFQISMGLKLWPLGPTINSHKEQFVMLLIRIFMVGTSYRPLIYFNLQLQMNTTLF
jgi:hypothetical protein